MVLKSQAKTKRIILYGFKILILLIVFLLSTQPVFAQSISDLQNQINDLQKQMDEQRSIISQKQQEAATLSNQIAIFNAQIYETQLSINKTQAEINATQAEIDRLNGEIASQEKELEKQKSFLVKSAVILYEEQDRSFIEVLLSSNSINEILDRSEYLDSLQLQIDKSMAQIRDIQAKLAMQKKDQEKKNAELAEQNRKLTSDRNNLYSQKIVKDNLLAETKGQEAIYKAKLSELSQRQQAISRWLGWLVSYGGGPSFGGWDGKCRSNCDSNYGCDPQCVGYVVMRSGITLWGNAEQWDDLARDKGYTVDSNPRVGDVMVWEIGPGMPFGHVAYVELVSSNYITVSQSNWGCNCCYSKMDVPKSSWTEYIHFK